MKALYMEGLRLIYHLEVKVLFRLGLAVGGVDGVDVVQHLVHVHLPVAQGIPASIYVRYT
jgi:hypothetical protein